jgi:hypothetical protein
MLFPRNAIASGPQEEVSQNSKRASPQPSLTLGSKGV